MDTQQNPQPSANEQSLVMAILAYIGPLVIVSFFFAKTDSFVKFHVKQGSVLFVIEVIVWVLGVVFWPLWPLYELINLIVLVLSIIGIVNAAQKKEKELPVVGSFAKHLTF